MVSMPSVAMKGWTLPRVTIRPSRSPNAAPTASPAPMPTSSGRPAESRPAMTAPETASTEPTLRSMPPVRMTKVMPAAITALMETCRAMLSRLLTVKNDPLRSERMTTSNAKAMTIPNRRRALPRRARGSFRSAARLSPSNSTSHPPGRRRHDRLLGGLGAGELRGNHTFMHDQDAVAHAEDLFHLRGDHHDPHPAPRQRGHQPVDLHFRAHVDAARRFDHQQHAGSSLQPFGHYHLLLRAPAEVADDLFRRSHGHVEIVDRLADERRLVCAPDHECRPEAPQDRQGDVGADAHREHQPQPLAILGDQADAQRDGIGGRANDHALPVQQDLPRIQRPGPKMAWATSALPEPINPAIPRISPRWTTKLMSRKSPCLVNPRTSRTGLPSGTSSLGNFSVSCRPTIRRMSSSIVSSATV